MSRPLNIVASPVIYKDKFLLIKRTKEPYVGFWSMVGGKIEFGEEIKSAISREIKEETGLQAKFVAVRGVVYETLKEGKKELDHFIIWACETRAGHDGAKEHNEGEVKWFSKADLKKHQKQIIPSDYAMINTFFLGKKKKIKLHVSKMKLHKGKYVLEFFG